MRKSDDIRKDPVERFEQTLRKAFRLPVSPIQNVFPQRPKTKWRREDHRLAHKAKPQALAP
jgi:hypothetical protein